MTFLLLWALLTEQIPEQPFAYIGKCPREVIVFDQENAPYFDKALDALLSLLFTEATEEEILSLTAQFVNEQLFDRGKDATPYLVEEKEIALEVFLEKQAGICRHYALTTTLLIDRLIKYGWLSGEVFLIRDETPRGRHGWTLFLSEKGAWHIDPYWNILKNGKCEKDFLSLCQKYGKQTMERQKKRWQK